MPHPHKRTWALGTLDREALYRLWFDPVAFRWEVAVTGSEDQEAGAGRAVASGAACTDRACAEGVRLRGDDQAEDAA